MLKKLLKRPGDRAWKKRKKDLEREYIETLQKEEPANRPVQKRTRSKDR